jgi:hypothetical protein
MGLGLLSGPDQHLPSGATGSGGRGENVMNYDDEILTERIVWLIGDWLGGYGEITAAASTPSACQSIHALMARSALRPG